MKAVDTDILIALYENPREIILYKHPKDPAGTLLTHIWSQFGTLTENEFEELKTNKKIIKLSDENGNGLSEAESCYYPMREVKK